MKSLILSLTLSSFSLINAFAQNEIANKPRVYFSSGFVTPIFYGGKELMNAYRNRQNGESHFQDVTGSRNAVGTYGRNTGFSLGIGYYIPIPKIKNLAVGLLVNSGQTGSTPSSSGYSEGYFFNFLNFGIGTQYYLFDKKNLYVKAEAGMGSVFTKNRFINSENKQDFLHHFGIGFEGGGGLGYTLKPIKNSKMGINLETNYQFYSTRVEVSGLGDDQWRFGALNLSAGIQF